MKRPGPHHRAAFTLVEALMAATILAMAIFGILVPFTVGAQNQQADARGTLAVNLAQELMEEILSKPFYDPQGASNPGPETGETTRNLFDNIDDYNGYSEPDGGIVDHDGNIVSDSIAKGLTRQADCAYVYVAGQDQATSATFIRVTVTVSYKGTALVSLKRLVFANR
jgi:Tfp pilus assembly protein PilV